MSSASPKEKLIFAPGGLEPSQYRKGFLQRSDLHPSPLTQFHTWFTHAQSSSVHQPETVCLSTAALPSGVVSSRYVYLKELDTTGFVMYSNYESRKAKDLETNPQASLAFWWSEVERQVRVEGKVERLSHEESEVYFRTRGRGSKIGAWASQQSKVLKGREELEERVKEVEKRWEGRGDEEIECPEFWGGIRVVPRVVEFWQGRDSRLHDRFRYTKCEDGDKGDGEGWRIERLSP